VLAVALVPGLLFVALAPAPRVQSDCSGYDAAARRLIATGSYAFPVGRALWSDDAFREDAWGAYLALPPNAWAMPGYSMFLAGIYRLTGTGPGRRVAVRCVQVGLAAITVVLLFTMADMLFPRRAAWIVAGLVAAYPPRLVLTGYLLTETLFTLLLVGQVAAMVWAARARSIGAWALLGALTAAAVYVRPVAGPVPLVLLAFELRRAAEERSWRGLGRVAAGLAISGVVMVALLAPWWVRNQRVYGVFLPGSSAMALPAIQGELLVRGLAVPDETYAQFALLGLTGNDDHVYAEKVAQRIRAVSPLRARGDALAAALGRARLLARALFSPFTFSSRVFPWWSAQVVLQATILALAGLGLRRHRRRPEVPWLIGGAALCVVLVHWQLGFLTPRYLYPAMPLLLLLAGAGIATIRSRRGAQVLDVDKPLSQATASSRPRNTRDVTPTRSLCTEPIWLSPKWTSVGASTAQRPPIRSA